MASAPSVATCTRMPDPRKASCTSTTSPGVASTRRRCTALDATAALLLTHHRYANFPFTSVRQAAYVRPRALRPGEGRYTSAAQFQDEPHRLTNVEHAADTERALSGGGYRESNGEPRVRCDHRSARRPSLYRLSGRACDSIEQFGRITGAHRIFRNRLESRCGGTGGDR